LELPGGSRPRKRHSATPRDDRCQVMSHQLALSLVVAAIASASAQSLPEANVLATVHITEPVLADGRPLAPGTYQVRLTGERVHILKGGDFLRISVKRQGVRYLIHLPVINETRINRPVPSPQ
jgi:hypothetical protein